MLVLSPRRPEKKLPDIVFDKQTGRPEPRTSEDVQDELIIEPNIDAVRKKQAYLVTDFGKQLARDTQDAKDLLQQDEYYIAVGTEEEKLDRPDRRVPPAVDFGKGPDRFP